MVTYGYDAVGNRVRETERDGASTVLADRQGVFDNLNRLQTLTDTARPVDDPERLTTFEWDANGNQVGKIVGSGPTAVTTRYVYDTRDKLVEAQQASGPGGSSTSILGRFQYDFEGRRTKKIGEEGLRQYVYDQTSLLAEYDASGSPKAKYDYGSDRLISLFRTDEGRRYFSLDGLRSVVNLTDDTGSAVASLPPRSLGQLQIPSRARPPHATASPSPGTSSTTRPASTTPRPATSIPSSAASSPRTASSARSTSRRACIGTCTQRIGQPSSSTQRDTSSGKRSMRRLIDRPITATGSSPDSTPS